MAGSCLRSHQLHVHRVANPHAALIKTAATLPQTWRSRMQQAQNPSNTNT
jgi:hypothetical protein